MKKIVLIDGSSLLVSSFYATAPKEIARFTTEEERERYYQYLLQTSSGIYTNAVFAMTRTLLGIIQFVSPDYMAVAFDENRETTFRKKMFPEYKAQRKPSPAPLTSQFQLMEEMLNMMNIVVLKHPEFEADDLIASMASKYERENPDAEICLLTKDHDYYQLVTNHTKVWMMQSSLDKVDSLYEKYGLNPENAICPGNCFEFDEVLVKEETGVTPEQIPDLKGIMGDASDNFKGIPGVGEAAAPILIEHYGTVENMATEVTKDTSKEGMDKLKSLWKSWGITRPPVSKVIEGYKEGLFCKELATMKKDCPIPELNDLSLWVDENSMKEELNKLEIKSLDEI